MSARNRLNTPTTTTKTILNAAEASGVKRFAAPLSSQKTGSRLRAGGNGDGGSAIWRKPASITSDRLTPVKYVEKHTIASTLRAASIRNKATGKKPATPRKVMPAGSVAGEGMLTGGKQPLRPWEQRRLAGALSQQKKNQLDEEKKNEIIEIQTPRIIKLLEVGVQTNEAEILNRELLVGDIKLLMPSPKLAKQIDKMRWQAKSKMMRKFATHEHDEEQHLDELKEFTERSYVTKRKPVKPPPSYEANQYRNVFKTMDEFFTQDIQKAESISNIQERIKRKEKELMSMFDDVEINVKSESESEGE